MTTIEIPTEQQPELKQEALTLVQQANGLTVYDQPSYDFACEFVKGVKALRTKAETDIRPAIDAAHKSWKKVLGLLQSIDDPLKQAEASVKGKIGAFVAEQDRIRREEEARAAAEQRRQQMEQIRLENEARAKAEAEARAINEAARRKAEEEQEAAIALAEAQGATVAEIEAIIMAPLAAEEVAPAPVFIPQARYVPPPPPPPAIEKAKGVVSREIWSGEVTDMKLLCAAIGRGEASVNLVVPNMAAINGLARIERNGLKVPGLRAIVNTSVAVGGR